MDQRTVNIELALGENAGRCAAVRRFVWYDTVRALSGRRLPGTHIHKSGLDTHPQEAGINHQESRNNRVLA